MAALPQAGATVTNGLVTAQPLKVVLEQERADAQDTQNQPLVGGLAQHVRKCWTYARDAKMQMVDERLLRSVRARRGDYDPEKLARIRENGGTDIFMMLTSVKCRAAGSWIRDVIAGQGEDRPWDIKPKKDPDLPPDIGDSIKDKAVEMMNQLAQEGIQLDDSDLRDLMGQLKDAAEEHLRKEAKERCDRMADKMETQLTEGGFRQALDQFIDDICTFPTAIIKGPIVRKKPVLKWVQGQDGQWSPQVQQDTKLEWERVSPFDIYPAPAATTVDDAYLIQRHRMSRQDLVEMIGVEGYDDASIRTVLDVYGRGGLREWLTNDVEQAQAEGKSTTSIGMNVDGEIDALQYWGSVQGKWLVEWGLDEKKVPDQSAEYHVEVWVIGPYVIRASLNFDPLNRKPYYKASYEDIPGSWWGNSVADLTRDSQTVVNAAARALVNNMGMASGPQVVVDVSRLPPGEDIETIVPWKIWQVSDREGSSGSNPPVNFFQPGANIEPLMQVIEKFSELADEYTGIPRYMTGDSAGGAGRTASGLSMLVTNAGKSIKQVISNIDMNMFAPLLDRLYYYNMVYGTDTDLKGDVDVIANGAEALMAKEAAQVRRNEFLVATNNPTDMQILGLKGRGAILRETVKTLDMDPDDIIPAEAILEAQQKLMAKQQQDAAAAGVAPPGATTPPPAPPPVPGQPTGKKPPRHGLPGPAKPPGSPPNPLMNGQMLGNSAPITDHFSPTSMKAG